MKQLFKFFMLMMVSLSFTASLAATNHQPLPVPKKHVKTTNNNIPTPQYRPGKAGFPISAYNSIVATGNVTINLLPPAKHRFAYIKNNQVDLNVINSTLYITGPKKGPRQPVTLWGNGIHRIVLSQNASLTAEKFKTRLLYLSLAAMLPCVCAVWSD